MWRAVVIFLVGGILGTAFGVAVGFFAFPYVFPPPEAMESLSAPEKTAVVARGTFIHANPSDPIHFGKGRVSVYERTVFLEEDFEVGPGPKFHVYLVPREKTRVSLGRLPRSPAEIPKRRASSAPIAGLRRIGAN